MIDELLECQDCCEKKSDVEVTYCPYASDLFNDKILIQVCRSCYIERVREI